MDDVTHLGLRAEPQTFIHGRAQSSTFTEGPERLSHMALGAVHLWRCNVGVTKGLDVTHSAWDSGQLAGPVMPVSLALLYSLGTLQQVQVHGKGSPTSLGGFAFVAEGRVSPEIPSEFYGSCSVP